MNLGAIILGAAGLVLGARTFNKGLSELSQGLKSGDPKVERDPRGRGSMGKTAGRVSRGRHGSVELREVRSLDERINAMRAQVQKGKTDPRVISWARAQVTRRCGQQWCVPEKNTPKEIAAIFNGMRQDVRYTSDVAGVDTYATPGRTLQHRAGDCLPGDTQLLTPRGFVQIDTIKIGDTIHDGTNWVRVTNWWNKGVLPTKRYELNNGSFLRCTDDHKIFRITRKNGEHVEQRAGDLELDDQLLQPRAFAAGHESLSAAHATIVGAYVAEGWWDNAKGLFCIAGVPGGKGLRERVVAAAEALGITDLYAHQRYIGFPKEAAWLVAGCGKLAQNKQLPHLDFDRETTAAIVSAMEAGDGGWSTSGKNMVYSTTSPLLAYQYRVLKRMLGISTHMRCLSPEEHGGAGFGAGGKGGLPIFRVTARSSDQKRPWAIIKSISSVGELEVFDIETESGRIYLPESDLIVHNCDDYATLGASALQALGIPARFKVIRTRDSQTWNHVYLQASATKSGQGPWISLDASVPVRAGWEVPRGQIAESRVFEVALDGYALR